MQWLIDKYFAQKLVIYNKGGDGMTEQYVKLNKYIYPQSKQELAPQSTTNILYNENNYVSHVGTVPYPHVNLEAQSIDDALTEINDRVAHCGRIFDEIKFDINNIYIRDRFDQVIRIEDNSYIIGNIIHFRNCDYILLYSSNLNHSVIIRSSDGISYTKWWESETKDEIRSGVRYKYKDYFFDMKCNKNGIYCIGARHYAYPSTLSGLWNAVFANFFDEESGFEGFDLKLSTRNLSSPSTSDVSYTNWGMAFDVDEYTMLVYWGNVDTSNLEVSLYKLDSGAITKLDWSNIDMDIAIPPIYIKSIKPCQYIMYSSNFDSSPFIHNYFVVYRDGALKLDIERNRYNIKYLSKTTSRDNLTFYAIRNQGDGHAAIGKLDWSLLYSPFMWTSGYVDAPNSTPFCVERCCNTYILYRVYSYDLSYTNNTSNIFNNTNSTPVIDKDGNNVSQESLNLADNRSFSCKINNRIYYYNYTNNGSKFYYTEIKI